MKRIIVLGALVTCGALSYVVSAQQPPGGGGQPAPRVVEVEKLKDNLFVLRGMGGGGNTAVFVQTDGVTVVDTKNPGWGQPTPRQDQGTDAQAGDDDHQHPHPRRPCERQRRVSDDGRTSSRTRTPRRNMEQMRPVTGIAKPGAPAGPNIFKENGGRGLPKQTFKDRMTLGTGNDRDRALLLRPRPHQRRRLGAVPGAPRRACGRHLRRVTTSSRSSTPTTAAARSRYRRR